MSEPIPESIPTSADPRSRRPLKRARGANIAVASQANAIDNLFLDPERPANLPAPSSLTKSSLAPPPEIVANVQGSSAGAGSGEFHVYKASRRREYERLRMMDQEAKKEEGDSKWEQQEREKKEKDDEKTRKNREKRNRRKGKKGIGLEVRNGGRDNHAGANGHESVKVNSVKKSLSVPQRHQEDDDDDKGDASQNEPESTNENGIVIHDED